VLQFSLVSFRPLGHLSMLCSLAMASSACNAPSAPVAPPEQSAVVEQSVQGGGTVNEGSAGSAPAPVVAPADNGAHANVEGGMPWLSREAALAQAAAEDRPMMVFVYTDWCPRCTELEPVFNDAAIIHAADGLVPVRHNQDENPAWLQQLAQDYEEYVPRVVFLNPDGTRMSIVSSHPRYPYFYTPSMRDTLVANMQVAKGS
jgi:thiol:disulfide interchange protein